MWRGWVTKAPLRGIFVFDLLGNSAIRFGHFNDTTSLPFKSNGMFHLGGKVFVTPCEIFERILENVVPSMKATGSKPSVIIPPTTWISFRALLQ
jgi:hypothetical protein